MRSNDVDVIPIRISLCSPSRGPSSQSPEGNKERGFESYYNAIMASDPSPSSASFSPPRIIRAEVRSTSSSSSSSQNTTTVNTLGLSIKRCDRHEGATVIYHVDPGSHAATHTELEVGCEVLGVNDYRVPPGSDPGQVLASMLYFMKKDGKASRRIASECV